MKVLAMLVALLAIAGLGWFGERQGQIEAASSSQPRRPRRQRRLKVEASPAVSPACEAAPSPQRSPGRGRFSPATPRIPRHGRVDGSAVTQPVTGIATSGAAPPVASVPVGGIGAVQNKVLPAMVDDAIIANGAAPFLVEVLNAATLLLQLGASTSANQTTLNTAIAALGIGNYCTTVPLGVAFDRRVGHRRRGNAHRHLLGRDDASGS